MNEITGEVLLKQKIELDPSNLDENAKKLFYKIMEVIDERDSLLKEKQELKKKLNELQTLYNNMFKCHCNRVQVETLLSQQKEFIKWLEDMLVSELDIFTVVRVCDVLSKYKEIIGIKDE